MARQKEKNRVKLVKEYGKRRETVPAELQIPVPDPWKIWAATDPEWLARQAARKPKPPSSLEDQPDDCLFVTDTGGDPTLQQDKIVFDDDSDSGDRFGYGLCQESQDPETDSDDEE